MKRFRWPLQRLLDVTEQRQRTLRAQLLALSRELSATRRRLGHRQAVLRRQLSDLGKLDFDQRIPSQQVFMKHAEAGEIEIRRLKEKVAQLESSRTEVSAVFIKTKAKTETLQRIREEARQAHLREQMKLEQGQFDESAHIAFARRHMAKHVHGVE